ncbi:MAG: amidohydrolase [Dehalococcoidia bacterium]|nr:amidohydrolase [Dehalococcoidia bacterium]
MADLILHRAKVITLNPAQPLASLVAVQGGVVVAVGQEEDLPSLATPATRLVNCEGATVLPAFHDAHCHLLALASSLVGVDCSPWRLSSIGEVQAAIRRRAEATPPGQWVRARGYHDALLRERRHPTRQDLDEAAPRHPVKLTHQSGHASVLSSLALAVVGIRRDTPDPPEGVIERDPVMGEPTGLLLEMEAFLEHRLPPLGRQALEKGLKQAAELFLLHGITAVQDATPTNSMERWRLWQGFQEGGLFPLRVTLMPGVEDVGNFREEGLGFGSSTGRLRVGHAKAMLTLTTGDLYPSLEQLRQQVQHAVSLGFPVAIHAVDVEAVTAAVEALRSAKALNPRLRHRVEHVSECPLEVARELGRHGWVVVTQPGFLSYNGDRYLQEVPQERQGWLYPLRRLLDSGVTVAASSDAPVVPPDPFAGLYAATTRRAPSGRAVNPGQEVGALEALRMYTINAAYAGCLEGSLGAIAVGKQADLVVLDQDPLAVDAEALKDLRVLMTVLGGEVVWQR